MLVNKSDRKRLETVLTGGIPDRVPYGAHEMAGDAPVENVTPLIELANKFEKY